MINVVSAFAYGCPRAFTDRENHLPTARTVGTKDPVADHKVSDQGIEIAHRAHPLLSLGQLWVKLRPVLPLSPGQHVNG
jgi:hypothetical protein